MAKQAQNTSTAANGTLRKERMMFVLIVVRKGMLSITILDYIQRLRTGFAVMGCGRECCLTGRKGSLEEPQAGY